MKELAAGHPLMAPAFEEREKELQARIDALPLGEQEVPGVPIQDSTELDSTFFKR